MLGGKTQSLPTTAHLYVIKEAKALTSSTDTSIAVSDTWKRKGNKVHETGFNQSHYKKSTGYQNLKLKEGCKTPRTQL